MAKVIPKANKVVIEQPQNVLYMVSIDTSAFLDTETAIMIANNYGIALTEEQGWFAKYGKVFVEIIKAVT